MWESSYRTKGKIIKEIPHFKDTHEKNNLGKNFWVEQLVFNNGDFILSKSLCRHWRKSSKIKSSDKKVSYANRFPY